MPNFLTPEQQCATAYHEAGHAITAFHYHIRVDEVHIVPDGKKSLGQIVYPQPSLHFRTTEMPCSKMSRELL